MSRRFHNDSGENENPLGLVSVSSPSSTRTSSTVASSMVTFKDMLDATFTAWQTDLAAQGKVSR
jgi:hypothetical protein